MPSTSADLVRLLAGLSAEQKMELREKLGDEVERGEDEALAKARRRAERGEVARKRLAARLAFAA